MAGGMYFRPYPPHLFMHSAKSMPSLARSAQPITGTQRPMMPPTTLDFAHGVLNKVGAHTGHFSFHGKRARRNLLQKLVPAVPPANAGFLYNGRPPTTPAAPATV